MHAFPLYDHGTLAAGKMPCTILLVTSTQHRKSTCVAAAALVAVLTDAVGTARPAFILYCRCCWSRESTIRNMAVVLIL